jgi:hypothetical protein
MLLKSTSTLNRAFRGPRGAPHTHDNMTHGGPNARRTEARRALGPPYVMFSSVVGHECCAWKGPGVQENKQEN